MYHSHLDVTHHGKKHSQICSIMFYKDVSDVHPNPANTKHLYNICTMLNQCRRRWADVAQMLFICFVFAGYQS